MTTPVPANHVPKLISFIAVLGLGLILMARSCSPSATSGTEGAETSTLEPAPSSQSAVTSEAVETEATNEADSLASADGSEEATAEPVVGQPEANRIAAINQDGSIFTIDATTGERNLLWNAANEALAPITQLTQLDTQTIAAINQDGSIFTIDATTGERNLLWNASNEVSRVKFVAQFRVVFG